jgi:hypothetical protein
VPTRTVHIEIDLDNRDHGWPSEAAAELTLESRDETPAIEVPLTAADVRGAEAELARVDAGRVRFATVAVLGERGGSLYLAPELPDGTLLVTEGRLLLRDGDRVAALTQDEARPAPRTARGGSADPP